MKNTAFIDFYYFILLFLSSFFYILNIHQSGSCEEWRNNLRMGFSTGGVLRVMPMKSYIFYMYFVLELIQYMLLANWLYFNPCHLSASWDEIQSLMSRNEYESALYIFQKL